MKLKKKLIPAINAGYLPAFILNKKQQHAIIKEFNTRIPLDMLWEMEVNRQIELQEERKKYG